MHFVSMISVRLQASRDVKWYLTVSQSNLSRLIHQFSKGMTALSLFIPLIATAFAFWFIGSENDFQFWRVIGAGIFVGLTSESACWQARPLTFFSRAHALLGVFQVTVSQRFIFGE